MNDFVKVLLTVVANLLGISLLVVGAVGWVDGRGYLVALGLLVLVASAVFRRRLYRKILPAKSEAIVAPEVAERAVRRVYTSIGVAGSSLGLAAIVVGLLLDVGWVSWTGVLVSLFAVWVLWTGRAKRTSRVQ